MCLFMSMKCILIYIKFDIDIIIWKHTNKNSWSSVVMHDNVNSCLDTSYEEYHKGCIVGWKVRC
jgi:hypothetical protein